MPSPALPSAAGKRLDTKTMVTRDEIEQAKTSAGGYTREQLEQWGVFWPLPKGWKQALTDEP